MPCNCMLNFGRLLTEQAFSLCKSSIVTAGTACLATIKLSECMLMATELVSSGTAVHDSNISGHGM